jgi:small subunit ribosomal protein S20
MANTKSAEKALRQSYKKKAHNLYWKGKIKAVAKNINRTLDTKNTDSDILNKELTAFQKVLDKAAKNKVIHKNKANRLKSRYAKKISAQTQETADSKPKSRSSKSGPKS